MKLQYDFNPFKLTGIEVPKSKKSEALSEIKDYVKEQVLSYIGEGRSPVENGHWKRSLSPSYKKEKGLVSSSNFANLELSGDLLDHLEVKKKSESVLSLKVTGGKEIQGKAEGNQIGSYGREPNKSNSREFIPTEGRTFKQAIISGIKNILENYGED